MDKVVWLVAGNKGGAGKSVVAKSLVEWLKIQKVPITVIDGDQCTLDVYSVFNTLYRTEQFNLHDDSGWALFSDLLCQPDMIGHVVTNLPDGVNKRVIQFFQKFSTIVSYHGFQVKVLFVMNTLPDGLQLFLNLSEAFPTVIPIKNLFFGAGSKFTHFDAAYGHEYLDKTILFPRMNPNIMQVVRESNMSFSEFIQQRDNSENNFIYAKIVVSNWQAHMLEAFDDFLIPN